MRYFIGTENSSLHVFEETMLFNLVIKDQEKKGSNIEKVQKQKRQTARFF
jgi:hypothetical protein